MMRLLGWLSSGSDIQFYKSLKNIWTAFPQVACPDSLYESFLAPGSGRCLGVGSLSQHHVVMASTLTNQFAAIKFSEIKSNTKCKLDINMPIICLLKSCILYVLFYMLDLNWHILVSVRNKEKSYLAI